MKILVLGAGGMAGHTISIFLREAGHDVDTLSAHNRLDSNTYLIDVLDLRSFQSVLDGKNYDAIVNCIGLLVKESEVRKDLAAYLNSFLPHLLERHFEKSKTRIIHISTDCVFSGKRPPYRENSEYDGVMFYDRSKALGEIINDKDLTFRQSIIGPDLKPHGTGLFNWFMRQHDEISGYTKSIWSGITTIELAKGVQAALEQNLTGLYHLVPSENISKYNLLLLLKKVFAHEDLRISMTDGIVQDKTLINTRKDFNYTVPGYQAMIEEMKAWVDNHPAIYEHYSQENYGQNEA